MKNLALNALNIPLVLAGGLALAVQLVAVPEVDHRAAFDLKQKAIAAGKAAVARELERAQGAGIDEDEQAVVYFAAYNEVIPAAMKPWYDGFVEAVQGGADVFVNVGEYTQIAWERAEGGYAVHGNVWGEHYKVEGVDFKALDADQIDEFGNLLEGAFEAIREEEEGPNRDRRVYVSAINVLPNDHYEGYR